MFNFCVHGVKERKKDQESNLINGKRGEYKCKVFTVLVLKVLVCESASDVIYVVFVCSV